MQGKGPGTDKTKCNADIVKVINDTVAFPAIACPTTAVKRL